MYWALSLATDEYVDLTLPFSKDNSLPDNAQKLQRRIANVRGVAPSASLPSPTRAATEELKQDGTRHDPANTESNAEGTVVAKRKYRRHPKVIEYQSYGGLYFFC